MEVEKKRTIVKTIDGVTVHQEQSRPILNYYDPEIVKIRQEAPIDNKWKVCEPYFKYGEFYDDLCPASVAIAKHVKGYVKDIWVTIYSRMIHGRGQLMSHCYNKVWYIRFDGDPEDSNIPCWKDYQPWSGK